VGVLLRPVPSPHRAWGGIAAAAALLLSRGALAEAPVEPADLSRALARLDAVSAAPIDAGWVFREPGFDALAGSLDGPPWRALPADKRVDRRGWFARRLVIPEKIGGLAIAGMRVRLVLKIDGDGQVPLVVYVDGHQVSRVDDALLLEPVLLAERAEPGRAVLLSAKTELFGATFLVDARLVVDRGVGGVDPGHLRDELRIASTLLDAPGTPPESRRALDDAVHRLDWAALDAGRLAAFEASVAAAHERLAALRPWLKRTRVVAAGHSHIDMAWLWPWTETVDVVRRTFGTVLDLMEQYPDLTFAQSSAQAYAWMEEKYPDLFAAVARRVKQGRWEPVGGMWVEPDLNLPDGESLARQLLYGQRYFAQKFGRPARIGWNPDSFGYSWQLPQLYRLAGIDAFVTQKLQMNDVSPFPHRLFWWEAPDGSRVLTYLPRDAAIDGPEIADEIAKHERDTKAPDVLHLFGVGDHGGGPTRAMIDAAHALAADSAVFPRLVLGSASAFFDGLRRDEGARRLALPTWRDELYLQTHRGAYTTDGAIKLANRRAESLLAETERFAALAATRGAPYPSGELAEAWRRLLFNQFHDILAGTGVEAVHRDALRDHADLRRAVEPLLGAALDDLAARLDTRGTGVPVAVANALAWPRSEGVEVSVPAGDEPWPAASVTGPDGAPVPSEVLAREPERHRVRVRFLARAVPSLGLAIFHVSAAPAPSPAPDGEGAALENERLRVVIDAKTGCLTSLRDKRSGRELVPPDRCANELQAFRDEPAQWDAWNLDAGYERTPIPMPAPDEVKVVERGAVRSTVRITRRFRASTIVQEIGLDSGSARVDVATDVDWRERHVLLKAAFPTTVNSDRATFEIPFGTISRSTRRRTPEEKAEFEVPALRWADLSDARHGLLLLSDSKSGFDVKDEVLRLTLLRGPVWPNPHVDEGRARFTYALVPHGDGWREAEAVHRGYELCEPLRAVVATPHAGTSARLGLVDVRPSNVVLAALKRAEDDDGLVLRLYETDGKRSTARVSLPGPVAAAQETDLLERPIRALAARGPTVDVVLRPYEIKTLHVRLPPPP
jgi:alpha-mannosidase